MKVYIVHGEHPVVPGDPMKAYLDLAGANASALELVGMLWEEFASIIDDAEILPPKLPDCWDSTNWKVALRIAQKARIAHDDDDEMIAALNALDQGELPWGYNSEQEFLAEMSEADVWIDELDVVDAPVAC